MTKKMEYRELFDLNSALLFKNDLFELEKMLVEDAGSDRINIQISFDTTIVSAESFGELLSNPGLPASADKLSITVIRWIETEDRKGISSGISRVPHLAVGLD